MEKPTLDSIYSYAFQEWLRDMTARGKQIYPTASHRCNSLLNERDESSRCTIVNVQTFVYSYVEEQEKLYHICTNYCKQKKLQPKLHDISSVVLSVMNIYICENSGKIHICNERCMEPTIQMPNGEHVCSMSGITRRSQYQDLYNFGDKYCGYTHGKKRARQQQQLKSSGSEEKANNKWMDSSGIEETLMNTARMKVNLLLFSEHRQSAERQKRIKLRAQGQQEVNKYIKHCEKNGELKCFMEADNRHCRVMESSKVFPITELTKTAANRLVEYYAYVCIAFHRHILLRIPQTEENRKTISDLIPCIPSILYLMSRGLKKGGIQIINPDSYLQVMLPGPNTLQIYNVNKTNFTHQKNVIAGSIKSAIESGFSPASISINQVSFEQIVNTSIPIHTLFQSINENTINMSSEK